ncbi:hypothetical protein BCCGELA001_28695 [Bradyrhizobium sp. CCGE-LA001]|nr:hypothetical protein BCCGELA001_28695 [Bradyrhizobium sp. CCGE-LA001]
MPQEICEQHMSSVSKYRFGMKLEAESWLITMRKGHDLAIFRTRGHHEIWRASLAELNDKRMVAADAKRGRQSCEKPPPVMSYMRGMPMHGTTCAHDASAENAPDALVSEADAENWDRSRKLAYDGGGYSRFTRRAGTGRDDDSSRLERNKITDADHIVPKDLG